MPHSSTIALSGTLAARPAPSLAGQLYFATDVLGGRLYRDTGSAWVGVAPSRAVGPSSVTTFQGDQQAASTDVTILSLGTIPANALAVGHQLRLVFGCNCDIVNSATARNLVWSLYFGATKALSWSVTVLVSAANTNKWAMGQALIAVAGIGTVGGGGLVKGAGVMQAPSFGSANADKFGVPTSSTNAAATAGLGLNTTIDQAVTVAVNESVNTVADIVRGVTAEVILL